MASNPFDQYDSAGGNPFDSFDPMAPPEKPKRTWSASDIVREPAALVTDTLAGMANIPIKAAKGYMGLYELLKGNGLDAATQAIGDRNPIKGMGSKSMEALGEKVISPAITKTAEVLGTDPSNVAAFVEAGGDIATLFGLGMGKGSPTSVAANRAGNLGKKTSDALSNRLMAFTLKQPTGMDPVKRKANVMTALEGDFRPSPQGVNKLNNAIADLEGQLSTGLSQGTQQGVTGSLNKAVDNVWALRDKAMNTADPYGNLNRINDEILRLYDNPNAVGNNLEMPIKKMQDMKVQQGRDLQKVYGEEKPQFQTTIDKARVRGLKEELEVKLDQAFPELAATNQKLGTYYQLKKSLENAANRLENSNSFLKGIVGKGAFGGMAGGALGGAGGAAVGTALGSLLGTIEHPAIAPLLARQLYKVNKGKITQRQALDMATERILGVTAGMLTDTGLSNELRDTQN